MITLLCVIIALLPVDLRFRHHEHTLMVRFSHEYSRIVQPCCQKLTLAWNVQGDRKRVMGKPTTLFNLRIGLNSCLFCTF